MKNIVLLILAYSVSFNVYAAGSLNVSPDTPVVITSDLQLPDGTNVSAPWIRVDLKVSADELITVTGYTVTTDSGKDGVVSFDVQFPARLEVKPGSVLEIKDQYLDSITKGNTFVVNVAIDLNGWIGGANKATGRFNISTNFKTQ